MSTAQTPVCVVSENGLGVFMDGIAGACPGGGPKGPGPPPPRN